MVVMLHQDCINGRRLRRVTCGCHVASGLQQWEEAQEGDLWLSCCIRTAAWEEAQEGDLWLSCCIRTASMGGGSGGRPVVMLHQDCINGRRLRRVTCGCHVASGLQQWEEAQEGDLWLSCCIRTASMGGGSGG